jgi:hypothetical protein
MKQLMIILAAVCLCCSAVYAADDCDSAYTDYMNKLKATKKIKEQQREKYLQLLGKAYDLCKQDKDEEADKIMDDFKDQFVHDALMNQQQFYGN